jgi:hypothetical protein
MSLLRQLFESLFGCTHQHVSHIFGSTQYCFDCGCQRKYSLKTGKKSKWNKPAFRKLEKANKCEKS